ncbi:MAG: SLBB domain-containing protein [Cyanobacteria bacterium P01_H01_bin.15]
MLGLTNLRKVGILSTVILTAGAGLGPLWFQPAASQPLTVVKTNPNETDYSLGAGDILRLDVFQVEEFSGEYPIPVDGNLTLPLVGSLQVEGLTLDQVTRILTSRYGEFLRYPIVTLVLVSPRPVQVAIAGEVSKPGTYTLAIEQQNEFPTVTDLLREASGITGAADVRQVQLRRSINGVERMLTLDLWDLIAQGNLNQNVTLRDGDSIFIPTKDKINPAETRQLIDANFGIQTQLPVNVAVVGEVYRPGSYVIEPQQPDRGLVERGVLFEPPRLTQAVQLAGGIKPMADVRNIRVRRLTRDGGFQVIEINLWELLQTGDINEDLVLQPGDTISIPTATEIVQDEYDTLARASFAPANIRITVTGEVRNPGIVEVEPNTPLNQGVLASGGFIFQRANQGEIELVRLNPNGTVSQRKIDLDLEAPVNEETNPALKNNDVIIVRRSGLTRFADTTQTLLTPFGTIFGIIRSVDLTVN